MKDIEKERKIFRIMANRTIGNAMIDKFADALFSEGKNVVQFKLSNPNNETLATIFEFAQKFGYELLSKNDIPDFVWGMKVGTETKLLFKKK